MVELTHQSSFGKAKSYIIFQYLLNISQKYWITSIEFWNEHEHHFRNCRVQIKKNINKYTNEKEKKGTTFELIYINITNTF